MPSVAASGGPSFGLVLSQINTRWEHVVADAQRAEQAGLDSIWLVDHLLAPFDPSAGIFEAWVSLAALAGRTERVRLGHLVNCIAFRNVGLLAKMAATLDHASGGRLELGLGAGWFEPEYHAFGYDFGSPGERRRALAETIEALDLLLAGGPVDYDGQYVRLAGAVVAPSPVQQPRPPITVGAGGPRMLELVGRHADVWNVPSSLLTGFEAGLDIVRAAAGGRPVGTTIQVPAAVGRTPDEAAAALELARTHLAWMGDVEAVGLVGTADRAAARVEEYRARGVDGFLCVLPGSRMRPQLIDNLGGLARSCH